MERLIVKQWEAFYEFFCRMRFLHGFVYSFDPSGLAGIIREKIKMVQMAPIPVFYLGALPVKSDNVPSFVRRYVFVGKEVRL